MSNDHAVHQLRWEMAFKPDDVAWSSGYRIERRLVGEPGWSTVAATAHDYRPTSDVEREMQEVVAKVVDQLPRALPF